VIGYFAHGREIPWSKLTNKMCSDAACRLILRASGDTDLAGLPTVVD
jgi:hypothetical protein